MTVSEALRKHESSSDVAGVQWETWPRSSCPVWCGEGTFVLRVQGQRMDPRFHDGEYIFLDPDVAADNGKFVVVRLENTQEATFKQLIIEGGRLYLKALNPDWPMRIMDVTENAFICGVVVFKGETI